MTLLDEFFAMPATATDREVLEKLFSAALESKGYPHPEAATEKFLAASDAGVRGSLSECARKTLIVNIQTDVALALAATMQREVDSRFSNEALAKLDPQTIKDLQFVMEECYKELSAVKEQAAQITSARTRGMQTAFNVIHILYTAHLAGHSRVSEAEAAADEQP